jgi:hypothetical protein
VYFRYTFSVFHAFFLDPTGLLTALYKRLEIYYNKTYDQISIISLFSALPRYSIDP